MWMVNTRATRVSTAVVHKHKYISNPTVTPSGAVVAAAKNLAKVLKGKLLHYVQELPLAKITRLSRIFSDATGNPEAELPCNMPVFTEPKLLDN